MTRGLSYVLIIYCFVIAPCGRLLTPNLFFCMSPSKKAVAKDQQKQLSATQRDQVQEEQAQKMHQSPSKTPVNNSPLVQPFSENQATKTKAIVTGEKDKVITELSNILPRTTNKQSLMSTILLSGDTIRNRWTMEGKIGGGAYGHIYKATDKERPGELVAVKVELITPKRDSRRFVQECHLMKELQGRPYMANVYGSGSDQERKINFMTMQLLSRNLSDLRKHSPLGRFSIGTAFRLGQQVLAALRNLHDYGYLHRDLKPSNLAMGVWKSNSHVLYLIDYGMVRRFKTRDGQLRKERSKVGFRGTLRYVSLRVHNRQDHCPADDLWSFYYTLIEMAKGYLPWRNMTDHTQVKLKKTNIKMEKLCNRLPKEAAEFGRYLTKIHFGDKPDYDLLNKYLAEAVKGVNVGWDDLYDWENKFATVIFEKRSN